MSDVLSELGAQVGGGTSYTFVGTTDHAGELPELRQRHGDSGAGHAR